MAIGKKITKLHWLIVAAIVLIVAAAALYWHFNSASDTALNPGISDVRNAGVASEYAHPASYADHLQQMRSFESSGGRIAYSDHGPADAAKTLLLIHGVPTSSWMYRKLIARLHTDLRVIAVDLLGYGASEKPAGDIAPYAYHQQAQYIGELTDALGLDSYALLVHDMGGLVGWELLHARAPISDFVLLNTIIGKEGFNHPTMEPGMKTEAIMKAFTMPVSGEVMLQNTFNELGLVEQHKLSPEECEGYVQPILSGSEKALYAFFTSLADPLFERLRDQAGLIQSWPGRWRVFWGGKDQILTTDQLTYFSEQTGLNDADVTIFNEQGHFLAEEVPDQLAVGVLEFLLAENLEGE